MNPSKLFFAYINQNTRLNIASKQMLPQFVTSETKQKYQTPDIIIDKLSKIPSRVQPSKKNKNWTSKKAINYQKTFFKSLENLFWRRTSRCNAPHENPERQKFPYYVTQARTAGKHGGHGRKSPGNQQAKKKWFE